jgi:hypothetical protein
VGLVKKPFPDYARKIAGQAKSQAGAINWLAAGAIVRLRDKFFPKGDAAHERIHKPKP